MAPKIDPDHPMHSALRSLKDLNSPEDYWRAVDSLEALLQNIKENPSEERYRSFPVSESHFDSRIGCLVASEKVMKAAGFKLKQKSQTYSMAASKDSWTNMLQVGAILYETLEKRPSKSKKSKKKEKSSSSSSKKSSSSSSSKKSLSRTNSGSKKSRGVEETLSPSVKASLRAAAERPVDPYGNPLEIPTATDPYGNPLEPPSNSVNGRKYAAKSQFAQAVQTSRKISSENRNPSPRRRGSTDSTASSGSSSNFDDEGGSSRGPSPSFPKSSPKDHWKSATTQALLVAKMRGAAAQSDDDDYRRGKLKKSNSKSSIKSKSHVLSSKYNDYHDDKLDGDLDDEFDAPHSVAKSRWLGAKTRIDAMHHLKESGGSSRRSRLSKSDSAKSMGSSQSSGSTRSGRPGMSRSGSKKFTESNRQLSKSERKLIREQSKIEKREKKLMEKEEKEIKQSRRRILERRIKEEGGPRWTFLFQVVTLLTLAELGLDLGTTVISFISLIESFDCCGQVIQVGTLTLGVTIPYFVLIVIELTILALSVRQARANSARDRERMKKIDDLNEEWFDDEESWGSLEDEKQKYNFGKLVSYILVVNPFLGALITWILLYEVSSRNEAFIILGLEGGAILLMFIGESLVGENFKLMLLLSKDLAPHLVTSKKVFGWSEKS
uniref:PUB domain-containing protein n=1 Tax=Entomoneis paludosa TaxID=265537 RepID=A0A7S2YNW5_9STRA|mmetsp:Transcript_40872/g.85089  ORF Transcript_40872/g.85089 Transcript_40872/m.85089 type:complete len:663 (+) Transcript_40872:181-2169(+)